MKAIKKYESIINEADAAMYESKKIEGNHAIIYDDLPQAKAKWTPLPKSL